MSELRKDPIVNRWVIIAPDRAGRPHEFELPPDRRLDQSCPFCEGNEHETPPEIVAYRDPGSRPDGPGWRVRVVPNKFPALVTDDQPQRFKKGSGTVVRSTLRAVPATVPDPFLNHANDGFYRVMGGLGAHEVIIESPNHLASVSELSGEQIGEVFSVYRDRLIGLKKDPRLAYGMIFKNMGASAGASIEHTHSQLIATPIVPINVWEEMTGALEFHHSRGCCVYCEMIRRELAAGERIVVDAPGFVAFCPYASRFPYETWILPKNHGSHYERICQTEIEQLAGVVKRVLSRIELALDRRAYNYIMHTAPFDTSELGHYHWHIEVMPSVSRAAGFEWGSGFHINSVAPEDAASVLRALKDETFPS
jgi:UDPglucose--hexose-1-phosphate uridylyltransferase